VEDADTIVARLGLRGHPEGGHYAETWRAPAEPGERAAGSAIYYLLRAGERSAWHRVDAAEVWHFCAGASLELCLGGDGDRPMGSEAHVLGWDLQGGARPQLIVPPGTWQAARCLGPWTLAGCTVSPAFTFEGFELADPASDPAG
jgi:uncharacterized protein